jgi:multiple sugar transport system permease protein
LGLIGIDIAWLAGAKSALIAIALVDTWQWLPFVILMFMAGLATIPEDFLEAAKVDGANQIKIFAYIFLPLLKPVIMIVVLLRVIETIKIFPKIYIMTEGGPGTATEIINFFAYRTTFQYSRFGYGSALCFNLFIITCLLSIVIITVMKIRSQ